MPPRDDRRIGFRHAELFEQLVHLRVGLEIQPLERHAVFRQEIADAKGILRVARADHAQAGEVFRLVQELPARDERLEDEVADFRVMIDELPQRVGRQLVDFAIAAGDAVTSDGVPVRCVTSPVNSPGPRTTMVFGVSPDSSMISIVTGLDDEELEIAVADFEKFFPVPVALEHRQRAACERCELGLVQFREGDCV